MSSANSSFMKQQDQKIEENVVQQIAWQPEIHSKDIGVKVNEGNVTLTGFVHTFLEKGAADRAAKSVVGVLSVANDIEVIPKQEHADPEIARDVVHALKLHSSVPDNKLKVSVQDGFVTLEGNVPWDFQRKSAARVAQDVHGVRGVINSIAITPTVSTEQVKEKIENAWKRTVDLDARRMTILENNGKVSLFGNVHSWNEREQAEEAAWQAPGVLDVSNYLVVTV